jgi:hypothetical protein
VKIHIYHHNRGVDEILKKLQELENKMTVEFDRLTTEVAENASVIDSVKTILTALRDELRSNPTPAQIAALADQLSAQSDALAAAAEENTPAEGRGR